MQHDETDEIIGWIDRSDIIEHRFLEKFHSNSKEEGFSGRGGRGISIAPEFKLDELIDVAERVGAPDDPRPGPRARLPSWILIQPSSLPTLIT